MSTGARFEFTQEQFDLLCADVDAMPIARGVAASSAFPGLLNSMTIDSFNANATDGGCSYDGPGSHLAADLAKLSPFDRDWVDTPGSRTVGAPIGSTWPTRSWPTRIRRAGREVVILKRCRLRVGRAGREHQQGANPED